MPTDADQRPFPAQRLYEAAMGKGLNLRPEPVIVSVNPMMTSKLLSLPLATLIGIGLPFNRTSSDLSEKVSG